MALTYLLALGVAAGALGVVVGVAAQVVSVEVGAIPSLALVGAVSALYLPRLLQLTSGPRLLQSMRQVPRAWMLLRPRAIGAALFGLGLGSGLYTRIMLPNYYLLFLLAPVQQDQSITVAAFVFYGVVRGLPVLWLALVAPLEDRPGAGSALFIAMGPWYSWMERLGAAHLALCGLWALWYGGVIR